MEQFCDDQQLLGLRDFLLGPFGPRGGTLAADGTSGRLTMARTAERVLRLLDVLEPGPCGEAVLSGLRAFAAAHDGGLAAGSLLCGLIPLLHARPADTVESDAGKLGKIVEACLDREKIRLDWGEAGPVLAMVKTALSSKGPAIFSAQQVDDLALNLVRGFLSCVPMPEQGSSTPGGLSAAVRRMQTEVITSSEDVKSYLINGFIMRTHGYPPDIGLLPQSDLPHRALAINIQLGVDGQAEEIRGLDGCGRTSDRGANSDKFIRQTIDRLVDYCENHGIAIVANQRVVGAEHAKRLASRNILCLERLGAVGMRRFCQVSGCQLNSSAFVDDIPEVAVGAVSNLELLEISGKDFARVWNKAEEHPTLVVTHWMEDVCEDIKILLDKTLGSLFSSLSQPYVLPGGGCVDGSLIRDLLAEAQDARDLGRKKLFMDTATLFRKIVMRLKSNDSMLSVDLDLGHLWTYSEPRCSCGAFKAEMSSWPLPLATLLSDDISPATVIKPAPRAEKSLVGHLLDNFAGRRTQLQFALETAARLSAVGAVIRI